MSNSTIVQLFNDYSELFVDVPGHVIGGWVGFGLFIVLLVTTVALAVTGNMPFGSTFVLLTCFSVIMVVVYLLTACEQFVFARDNSDHVNLLMIIVNIAVWLFVVFGSARSLVDRPPPHFERLALALGIISQVLFLLSAFVWNGVVFALWAIALILMFATVGIYVYTIIEKWPHTQLYSRAWLFFVVSYTFLYLFVAFLSHLYLAVMSLSGAVWAYLVMHLCVYAWIFFGGLQQLHRAPGNSNQKGRAVVSASGNGDTLSLNADYPQ